MGGSYHVNKFSRKTFLKGSVAGLGMMALNVCTAGAASADEPAAVAGDTNSLNLVPKKQPRSR